MRAANSFFEEVKKFVEEDQTSLGVVANLHGVADSLLPEDEEPKPQSWLVAELSASKMLNLYEAAAAYTFERPGFTTIISDDSGKAVYPPQGAELPAGKALLFVTTAKIRGTRRFVLNVTAPEHEVAVYIGGGGAGASRDEVRSTTTLHAGTHLIAVLVYGGTQPIAIQASPGVELLTSDIMPSAPVWVHDPQVFNLDPARGLVIAQCKWMNDPFASTWGVYRNECSSLGRILSITEDAEVGTHILRVERIGSGAPVFRAGETLYTENFTLGVVLDWDTTLIKETRITVRADEEVPPLKFFFENGTVSPDGLTWTQVFAPGAEGRAEWTYLHAHQATEWHSLGVVTNAGGETVPYEDRELVLNRVYLYRMTAFGIFGDAESDYSLVESIFSNDREFPAKIIITDPKADHYMDGRTLVTNFNAPEDLDYKGVQLFKVKVTQSTDVKSATVRSFVKQSLILEPGEPKQRDQSKVSLEDPDFEKDTVFLFFCSYDHVGNIQQVEDYYLSDAEMEDKYPNLLGAGPQAIARKRPYRFSYLEFTAVGGLGDQPRLVDFREAWRDGERIRFAWTRPQYLVPPDPPRAHVDKIYTFKRTFKVPLAPETIPWPTPKDHPTPDILGEASPGVYAAAENQYEVIIPEKGYITYLQFEPLTKDKKGGVIRRVMVFGTNGGLDEEYIVGTITWEIHLSENETEVVYEDKAYLPGQLGALEIRVDDPLMAVDSIKFDRTYSVGAQRINEKDLASDGTARLVGKKSVPLHVKHNSTIEPIITLNILKKDGVTPVVIRPGAESFDVDSTAEIVHVMYTGYVPKTGTMSAYEVYDVVGDSDCDTLWSQESTTYKIAHFKVPVVWDPVQISTTNRARGLKFPVEDGAIRKFELWGVNFKGQAGPKVDLATFDESTLIVSSGIPLGTLKITGVTGAQHDAGQCGGTPLTHRVTWTTNGGTADGYTGFDVYKWTGKDAYGSDTWELANPISAGGLPLSLRSYDVTYPKFVGTGSALFQRDFKYRVVLRTVNGSQAGEVDSTLFKSGRLLCG